MIVESTPIWPSIVLALVLFGDILMSLRPMAFIKKCLTGVGLPKEWWWALVYVKGLAVVGLIVGLWIPGVGPAAMVGAIAYFIAAAFSHIKAQFLGSEFWINCLGMLFLSIAMLALTLTLK